MYSVVVNGTEMVGVWERSFSLPSFTVSNCGSKTEALMKAKIIVGEKRQRQLSPTIKFFYSIEQIWSAQVSAARVGSKGPNNEHWKNAGEDVASQSDCPYFQG